MDIRKTNYTMKSTTEWMRLPTETVPASYSEVFKTCLDKVLNVLVRAVFALNSSLG